MLKKAIYIFDATVVVFLFTVFASFWYNWPDTPVDGTSLDILVEELNAPIPVDKPKKLDTAAIVCMTDNIYHEARGESIEGQLAVFSVTINRVREQRWGQTVCDVVYYPFAFSWTLDIPPVNDYSTWLEIRDRVKQWIKQFKSPVGVANHYHTKAVNPTWNASMDLVDIVGAHMFFKD